MTLGLITSVKFRGFNEEKPVQGPTDAVPTACFCRSSPLGALRRASEEKENELKELVHPSCRKPWRREGMAKSALWSRVCDTGFGRQVPTIEGSLTTGLFV